MLQSIHGQPALFYRAALRFRSLARPAALAGAMFLMMRAELLMHVSPLAAALMAAALAAGDSAAALTAGCLLGIIRLSPFGVMLMPLFACILVLALELVCTLVQGRLRIENETRCAVIAGIAVLLPGMIHAGGETMPSLQTLACAMLAAAGAPFFLNMLMPKFSRSASCRTGRALMYAACLTGAAQLYMPAAQAFAVMGLMLFPAMQTAAICGLALTAGGANPMTIASLALCSLGCAGRFLHKRSSRALFVCAASGLARLMCGPGAVSPRWALCACAAYLMIPETVLRRAGEVFAPPRKAECSPDEIAREICLESRRRISALGEAFAAMAEKNDVPANVPDEQELICEMRARLCTGCLSYESCWTGCDNRAVHLLCSLIPEALSRVDAPPGMRVLFSDGEIPPDVLRICRRGRMIPDRLGLLLRDFAEKRRSEIKRCDADRLISLHFLQAREILQAMAEKQILPAGNAGFNLQRLKSTLDHCRIIAAGRDASQISLIQNKSWTSAQTKHALHAVQRCMGGYWHWRSEGEILRMARAPHLEADTGASCQSGVAGEACGDSHIIHMLDENRLLLAISDGMGCGSAASAESMQALKLLRRFLDAGISRPLALETVNRQLITSGSDDMFATMDLCIIDLDSGIAEFSKLAACRTLILRGREILRIDGGCLPLGILENVQTDVSRVRLRPGDTLIMGSDGVMEAGDMLLAERLAREYASEAPEQIAARLVRQAGMDRSAARRDDLTCICARIRSVG